MALTTEIILDFIQLQQQADGRFLSYESYPPGHPLHHLGWHSKDPSPFIHANILMALSNSEHPKAKEIIRLGIPFVQKTMEPFGFWRFWPHGGQTHNVPLDLDDTSVCSFLLKLNNNPISNEHLLLRNTGPDGHLVTWVLPRPSFWRYPRFWWWLKKDVDHCRTTIQSPMLDVLDVEPAVIANVLLYVRDHPKAQTAIQYVLQQLGEPEKMTMQYYADPIVPYYHASRAFHHGCTPLQPLVHLVSSLIHEKRIPILDNLLSRSMAISTLHYLGLEDRTHAFDWYQEWSTMDDPDWEWPAYPYFVSKDHNFRAGSPALTAAFYLEARQYTSQT